MSDSDYKLAKQLQAALQDPNNGLPKNTQSLFKEIGITSKDFDQIGEEVKRFEKEKTKTPNPNHNYSQLAKLERLLSQDPSLFDTYNAWIADVEKAIGKDVGNPSLLTEEDMKKIPPAPEKLQELARFMMSVNKQSFRLEPCFLLFLIEQTHCKLIRFIWNPPLDHTKSIIANISVEVKDSI